MPFGLDIKSMVVGILLYALVFPYVMGLLNRNKAPQNAPA